MNNAIREKIKKFFSIDTDNKIVVISLVINFLVCFASYSAFIVNGFCSPDGITEGMHVVVDQYWQLAGCGRWATVLINYLRANLVFHWYSILECFMLDWLSAHTINKILENKNKLLYCISCAFFTIIPPIISFHTYIYASFAVHLTVFLCVAFVYLNQHKSILLSILASVCLGFAMGMSQAFIGLPVGLTMICFIKKLINDENDKYLFISKTFLSGVGGGLIYILGLNISLKITGFILYNRAASFSLGAIFKNLLSQIKENYESFIMVFIDHKFKRMYIYLLIFIIFLLEIMGLSIKQIKEKKYLNMFLILLSIILLPVCFNFIGIIMPNEGIGNLDVIPDYLCIFLIIYLIDYIYFDKKKIAKVLLSLCLLFLSWTFVLSANATYDSYRLSYNYYKNCYQSALDQVYELDDYELNKTAIVVVGYPSDNVLRSNIRIYDYAESLPRESLLNWANTPYMTPTITSHYLLNVFGVDTVEVMNYDDYIWFINLEEVKNMPNWPNKGCVKMVEGYAAIKFCEDYE